MKGNKDSGCVENDDVVREEAAQVQKNPTLRKPQRSCHNTGSTKETVLEVNPYLERNMTIHKRKEAHHILSYTRSKLETTRDKFLIKQTIKH